MKVGAIIVPLDGSQAALAALPVAAMLRTLFTATIHLLYAGEADAPPCDLLQDLGLSPEQLRGAVLRPARGEPAEAIIHAAAAYPHALIVMCTCTGCHNAADALGSVGRAVLAAAPCPLLFVRPERGVQPWSLHKILLPHAGAPNTA